MHAKGEQKLEIRLASENDESVKSASGIGVLVADRDLCLSYLSFTFCVVIALLLLSMFDTQPHIAATRN